MRKYFAKVNKTFDSQNKVPAKNISDRSRNYVRVRIWRYEM